MFPNTNVRHVTNGGGVITVSFESSSITYLGDYKHEIDAARTALLYGCLYEDLYSYEIADGVHRYYAVAPKFPVRFFNMYNYGNDLIIAINRFDNTIWTAVGGKPTVRYMIHDTYVVTSAPRGSPDRLHYGSVWIENIEKPRHIEEGETAEYTPYGSARRIGMLVCKTPMAF